jgi:NADPH:quinone reductase-like Zn-dependent oxidoreductase
MRAALYQAYGSPAVLRLGEIPPPIPKKGELLVRVFAATINRTDCALLAGQPWINRMVTGLIKPRNPIPGTDFAGEVVATGSEKSAFQVGDRIFGLNDAGLHSHAEYLCISEKAAIALLPVNTSFEDAVACLEGAHYAINFLNKVYLKAGDRVLVNGASGGIGSALVQLLCLTNAHITAVCAEAQFPLLRSLGAQNLIDYQTTDFTRTNETYHFIFDAVGKSTFGRCKPNLLPGGVYISSELGPWGQNLFYALSTPLMALLPGAKKQVKFPIPTGIRQNVQYIRSLIEAGQYQPVIEKSYPFNDIQSAYEHAASGRKIGNVVVRINVS